MKIKLKKSKQFGGKKVGDFVPIGTCDTVSFNITGFQNSFLSAIEKADRLVINGNLIWRRVR